jgi:hypothetical protein
MKRAGNVTHGKSRTPAWRSYHAMMTRCYNERQRTYQQYGGRGITVCDRWRAGFEFFYADMGDRPDGMTLDRLDVNAGYSPSNCRWATDDEQVNNKQDSVILEWQGERLNVAQWSAKTGISRGAIETRIKLGWDIEKTLTIPAVLGRNQFGEGGVPVEFNGEVKTWMQWSESTGIAYATLKKRIEAGWSVERALSTPLLVVRRKR